MVVLTEGMPPDEHNADRYSFVDTIIRKAGPHHCLFANLSLVQSKGYDMS